ncbi:hypothetical protein SAR03_11660 [Staphylococcus arlettae]|uniref:Uncharacterized protein n=1 Tax=Staphylococcus arlettae TaxID=29378 RepID=A0ABQ0XTT8_9STAP|nr:hypothetical protein SAR03_11660 [Staphylococcus arlettae]
MPIAASAFPIPVIIAAAGNTATGNINDLPKRWKKLYIKSPHSSIIIFSPKKTTCTNLTRGHDAFNT